LPLIGNRGHQAVWRAKVLTIGEKVVMSIKMADDLLIAVGNRDLILNRVCLKVYQAPDVFVFLAQLLSTVKVYDHVGIAI